MSVLHTPTKKTNIKKSMDCIVIDNEKDTKIEQL